MVFFFAHSKLPHRAEEEKFEKYFLPIPRLAAEIIGGLLVTLVTESQSDIYRIDSINSRGKFFESDFEQLSFSHYSQGNNSFSVYNA